MMQSLVRVIAQRVPRYTLRCFQCLHTSTRVNCSLVDDDRFRKYVSRLVKEYEALTTRSMHDILGVSERDRLTMITRASLLGKELNSTEKDLLELSAAIKSEHDVKMTELLETEYEELRATKDRLFDDIVTAITPTETDDITNVILEVQAGVGGLEAGMFAYDLYLMYQRFASYHGWQFVSCDIQEMEGATSSSCSINKIQVELCGSNVYKILKYESGIHRVQRVPLTDKAGRIHTSTAVVIILPKPADIKVDIQQKDIKIDTFKSRGGGGQSVNTTDSAVRLTHIPTGTVVECQQTRSQIKNRNIAMGHLHSRLYEQQLCDRQAKHSSLRRLQIGGANRNEKIRTYNYVQDRVTDHRVKLTVSGISQLMDGNDALDNFLESLMSLDEQERFKQWLTEQADSS